MNEDVLIGPQEIQNLTTGIPTIAADREGNLHVLWFDRLESKDTIWYARFDPTGALCAGPQSPWDVEGHNRNPAVTLDGEDTLQVIWWNLDYAGDEWSGSLYHARLDTAGDVLVPPRRLDLLAGRQRATCYPSLTQDDDGNLQALIGTTLGEETTLLHVKLDRQGTPLTGARDKIGTLFGADPTIACGGAGNVHVLWTEYDHRSVWHAKLDRDGNRLTGPTPKLEPGTVAGCDEFRHPSVAPAGDGDLHVVCAGAPDRGEFSLWYARLDQHGGFVSRPTLKLDTGASDLLPALSVDPDGGVYLMWRAGNLWYAKLAGDRT